MDKMRKQDKWPVGDGAASPPGNARYRPSHSPRPRDGRAGGAATKSHTAEMSSPKLGVIQKLIRLFPNANRQWQERNNGPTINSYILQRIYRMPVAPLPGFRAC